MPLSTYRGSRSPPTLPRVLLPRLEGRAGDGRRSSSLPRSPGARFRDFGLCSGRRDVYDRPTTARRRCAPTRGRTGTCWGHIAWNACSPHEVAELIPIGYHAILRAIRAAHVIEEFDPADRRSAEEQIRHVRGELVSPVCHELGRQNADPAL